MAIPVKITPRSVKSDEGPEQDPENESDEEEHENESQDPPREVERAVIPPEVRGVYDYLDQQNSQEQNDQRTDDHTDYTPRSFVHEYLAESSVLKA